MHLNDSDYRLSQLQQMISSRGSGPWKPSSLGKLMEVRHFLSAAEAALNSVELWAEDTDTSG